MELTSQANSLQNKFIELSPFSIMVFQSVRDENKKIVDFTWLVTNPSAEKLVGRTHTDLLGKNLLKEMPGNLDDGLFEKYKKVVETETPISFEHFYDHEGLKTWFQIDASKYEDGFIVIFQNITSLKNEATALTKLIESQQNLYQLLFKNMRDCVAIYKAIDNGEDFEFVDFNPSGEKAENIKKDELIGKRLTEVFPGVKEFGILDEFKKVFKSGEKSHFPLSFYDDDRISGWRENYIYKLDKEHIVAVYLDVTKEKQAEAEIKLSAKVFDTSLEGILITDKDANIIKVNQSFCQMSGFKEKEILGVRANILKSNIHPDSFYQQMWDSINNNSSWQGEIWDRKKDGSAFAVYLTISVIYDEDGNIKNYIGVYLDITEKLKTQEKIQKLAFFDTLTDLPNRSHFNDELNQYIHRSLLEESHFALLFVDLDNFKGVNDTYGHNIGDLLLIEASKIIKKHIREIDFVARLSGDEFVILCQLKEDAESEVGSMAMRIIENLKKPIAVENHSLQTGCSIGISIFPEDGKNALTLMKSADIAMYKSKADGRNRFYFHSKEMYEDYTRKHQLEDAITYAINNDEFEVFFQPKVCPYTESIYGAEALIRWNSKTLGFVSPLEFITFSEENKQIIDIGNIVIEKTFEFIKVLEELQRDLKISINISSVQLHEKNFLNNLFTLIEKYKCPAHMIELEITESKIMDNVQENIATLNKIKEKGIEISIDDFGTGYSSMSYLQKLPANTIKIDRSFVADIETDKNDATLITGIVSLTKALSLKTVAEGAETIEQVNFLKEIGCDLIQGYYYSKPIPPKEFLEFIKSW